MSVRVGESWRECVMWESGMDGENGVLEKEREEGEGKDSGELRVGTEVRYYLLESVWEGGSETESEQVCDGVSVGGSLDGRESGR